MLTVTTIDYDEVVARGIAALDEHGPGDWRERVDVESLDVASGVRCVLGQVFDGSYYSDAALAFRARVPGFDSFALGFDLITPRYGDLPALNQAWHRALLRERPATVTS